MPAAVPWGAQLDAADPLSGAAMAVRADATGLSLRVSSSEAARKQTVAAQRAAIAKKFRPYRRMDNASGRLITCGQIVD